MTVSAGSDFSPTAVTDPISGVELLESREIPTGPSGVSIRRLTITAREPYPFILGVVLRKEAIPNRIVLQHGSYDVVVTVQEWDAVRALADEVEETFGAFELESVNQMEHTGEPLDSGRLSEVLVSKLSEDQLRILETAYNMGYFDVPREASAGDLADELDIAQSTLSERLRVAQRNLLELLYGARDTRAEFDVTDDILADD